LFGYDKDNIENNLIKTIIPVLILPNFSETEIKKLFFEAKLYLLYLAREKGKSLPFSFPVFYFYFTRLFHVLALTVTITLGSVFVLSK